MLSVLIPVYNWDITNLVKELHEQCVIANIDFEIVAVDDHSTKREIPQKIEEIQLPHFQFIKLEKNVGNAEARNILARTAKFQWLLFLDADMIPAISDFISKYLNHIQANDFDIMSGGIVYENSVSPEYRLKWLHGKKTEEQIPDKDPYLEIRGNNFLVRKEIFLANPFGGLPENYGYVDTHFGLKLKQAQARVKIISNPCVHLGLETNEKFVQKYKTALRNGFWLMNNQPELAQNLRIVQTYKKIKSWRILPLVRLFYRLFEKPIYGNLTSNNPNLTLFQIYKLGYFSTLRGS